jgi:hypothetical protein
MRLHHALVMTTYLLFSLSAAASRSLFDPR